MRGIVFMLLFPSLIAADVLCTNGKTTCPDDSSCCEINGEQTCCNHEATTSIPDSRKKVYPGIELSEPLPFSQTYLNTSMSADVPLHYGECVYGSCKGPCCSSYSCCDEFLGSCCNSYTCCPSLSKCCNPGCCGFMQSCCGTGCCKSGSRCCGGWCCDSRYSCGTDFMTCGTETTFSPAIASVLILAIGALMSRHF